MIPQKKQYGKIYCLKGTRLFLDMSPILITIELCIGNQDIHHVMVF